MAPITGSMALGAGVMSYACQLNFTEVADRDSYPDTGVFTDRVQIAFDELAQPTLIPAS
jgi:hypothetical protein